MSAQEQAPIMPSIQGEAMELFTRVPPLPINSNRGGGGRGSHVDGSTASPAPNASARRFSGRRPSTSAGDDGRNGSRGLITPQRSQGGAQEAGLQQDSKATAGDAARSLRPVSRGEAGSGRRDGGRSGGTPEVRLSSTTLACGRPYLHAVVTENIRRPLKRYIHTPGSLHSVQAVFSVDQETCLVECAAVGCRRSVTFILSTALGRQQCKH